jgi:hypothetical protein
MTISYMEEEETIRDGLMSDIGTRFTISPLTAFSKEPCQEK